METVYIPHNHTLTVLLYRYNVFIPVYLHLLSFFHQVSLYNQLQIYKLLVGEPHWITISKRKWNMYQ